MVGQTLEQRALTFHRKYPEVKISPNKLYLIYRRAGIKYKMIKLTKVLNMKK